MNLINIEKIDKEPKVALAPAMPYVCPICSQIFKGSEVVEKQMHEKDFWFRYAGQLVNHITKNHMANHVDKLFKDFKSKEENRGKKFGISYNQHIKMNNMSKKLILDEVPKKFPRTVAISLIKAMTELEDNNPKIKEVIQESLSEMEALK